jgi:hypothetical protein
MAIDYITAKDTDGVAHYIDKQDEPMSCALACIDMVYEQATMTCGALDEVGYKNVSALFPRSLLASQLKGDNGGLGFGTWADNVESTLKHIGVPVSKTESFTPAAGGYGFKWQKPRIRSGFPAVILVGWYSNSGGVFTRNGGHFIVAARTTRRGYVVVLDPASGTLHELHGANGYYLNHGLSGRMEVMIYTG